MKNKILSGLAAIALVAGFFSVNTASAVDPDWDMTGSYVVNMEYGGTNYPHDVNLTQAPDGTLSGSGGSPAGSNVYTWVIDSGDVEASNFSFIAHYTATPDAVTPLTVMNVTGTIGGDGTLSGTWTDNYQGGSRNGTFMSTSGMASEIDDGSTTVVVTPTNTQGFSTVDTRPGGAVNFIEDATSPAPTGALQLTTNATNEAKAQYLHTASGALAGIDNLSYYTKQNSGPAVAAASYQLAIDANGATTGGFTNLVYEPYWNGTVVPTVWQQWDVDAGEFWSSGNVTCSMGSLAAGAGGPPLYSLADVLAVCPEAVVLGFGVNVGSYNPSYNVEVDNVVFQDTTYNFEVEEVDETAPAVPTHVFPANGATLTSAELTKVDWTDVVDDSGDPVVYYYQSSLSSATNPDGSFVTPAYSSGPLTMSEIPTPGTPEGTYYWHVRAEDSSSNTSAWSSPWSFTVDNTPGPILVGPPTNKDQCKNGGWMTFNNPSFPNQGQCVSYVNGRR